MPNSATQSIYEATENQQAGAFTPKNRVARIKVLFLEDGAISLNNRQYPKESVDAMIRSAQIKLSDPTSIPMTCYINHNAADSDNTLELVGKIADVWREGAKAFAYIDIPDTRAGRDVASLIAGGYLRTESLRASNAKILHGSGKGIPQVGGDEITLDGIDFTTTPGLQQVARIQSALLESSENETLSEFFTLSPQALLLEAEKGHDMDPNEALHEADNVGAQGIPSTTSGDSPFMTSDPTQDSYGSRMYNQPPMTSGPMQGMMVDSELKEAVQHSHDHTAACLGLACAPAGLKPEEAGKALSSERRKHLEAVHKKTAGALSLECVGAAMPANDGMQDGDDDDQPDQSSKKESKKVTYNPNQLAEALRKAGYTVEAPKTEAQLLQERLEAQERQMAELREMIAKGNQNVNEGAPQRKSMVMGAGAPRKPANMPYKPGSYLREQLKKVDWEQLADRTAPLPEGLALEHLIKEFTDLRIVQNFEQYGWPESIARELGVY